MGTRSPMRWVREHPTTVDVLLALAVTAVSLPALFVDPSVVGDYRETNVLAVALVLCQTLPLVARRRWPVPVLAFSGFSAVVYEAFGFRPTGASIAVIISFYTVAAYTERRRVAVS